MKRLSFIALAGFAIILATLAARPTIPPADLQSTLETAFPNGIVETFDNLQDWAVPPGALGYINSVDHPTYMPKTTDGSYSHWSLFYANVDTTKSPWIPLSGEENLRSIANFGPNYSLWGGKSACLSYANFTENSGPHPELAGYNRAAKYGPGRLGIYFGNPGDPTSGLREVYVFYRFKFSKDRRSLTGGPYTWIQSAHGTEEYYLNVASPGIFCPNDLTINGSRISHLRTWKHYIKNVPVVDNGDGTVKFNISFYPGGTTMPGYTQAGDTVTIAGTTNYNGTYTVTTVSDNTYHQPSYISIAHAYVAETPINAKLGVTLGHLGTDQWVYGDNDSLGYKTIYIRLSGASTAARNPNNKSADYIRYECDFWNREPPTWYTLQSRPWTYFGYPKHLELSTGFTNSRDYISQGWVQTHAPNVTGASDYGLNFHVLNLLGAGQGIYDIGLVDYPFNAVDRGGGQYSYDVIRNSSGNYFLPYSSDYNGTLHIMANSTTKGDSLYESDAWSNVEYRLNLGTKDNFDGAAEFWLYDDSGNVLAHNTPDPTYQNGLGLFKFLTLFNHKVNKITWGGNKIVDGYGVNPITSWNNRWYLDDVIINPSRIGPTYFGLLQGHTPPTQPRNLQIKK